MMLRVGVRIPPPAKFLTRFFRDFRFRIGFRYAFRWLPCVHITKQEYLESDLHRDRFNVSSATCRRRSTATYYKNCTSNGNISPPSFGYRSNETNRRTTSICTQVSHAEESERHDQEIALLDARRISVPKRRATAGGGVGGGATGANDDVAV